MSNTNPYIIKNSVIVPERHLQVHETYDVIVAGGGTAGIAAAIGAARAGAKTLLIEKNGFFGGVATAGLMALFGGTYQYSWGITREIYDRLIVMDAAVPGPVVPFDPEELKFVAQQLLIDAGAKLLTYTNVVSPIEQDGVVKGVVVENKQGMMALLGKTVVDCTGDGDVAAKAGAPFSIGRQTDNKMRPVTVLFRMGNVDLDSLVAYAKANRDQFMKDNNLNPIQPEKGLLRLAGFFDLVEEAKKHNELEKEINYLRVEGVSFKKKIVYINSTRVYNVNGLNSFQLTEGDLKARKQVRHLVEFLKKRVPGFSQSHLIDSASSVGVRETRHIKGQHIVTIEEILESKKYDDSIGKISAHLPLAKEMHSPDGGEGGHEDLVNRTYMWPLHCYELPYRALIPQEIEGLVLGGRCISVTHEADRWTRNMPCCMVTGQAAGIAGAVAAKSGVYASQIDRQTLRAALKEQKCLED